MTLMPLWESGYEVQPVGQTEQLPKRDDYIIVTLLDSSDQNNPGASTSKNR